MDGLKQFNDSTLDLAIESCRKTLEMPPTLPKFISICCNFNNQHCVTAKRIEAQQGRTKVGDEALMAIKKMLGMRN